MKNEMRAWMNEEVNLPVIGGVYRHFKGNCYTVLAIAKDAMSEPLKSVVVYKDKHNNYWTRPVSEWNKPVDENGVLKNRFEYIGFASIKELYN